MHTGSLRRLSAALAVAVALAGAAHLRFHDPFDGSTVSLDTPFRGEPGEDGGGESRLLFDGDE
jgi:hypothetical protein